MTNLTILYATDDLTARLHGTPESRDWEVFYPSSINEALAMSVFYAPHVVVIDGDSEWLNELTYHLTAVTGPSPRLKDIVVRLADDLLDVDVPSFIDYHELSADTRPQVLAQLLIDLDMQRGGVDTLATA